MEEPAEEGRTWCVQLRGVLVCAGKREEGDAADGAGQALPATSPK